MYRARLAYSGALTYTLYQEVYDDEKIDFDDIIPIGVYTLTMVTIWSPELADTAVGWGLSRLIFHPVSASVWVPLAVGTAVSYGIDEEEGVKNFWEFVTEPKKWGERTGESFKKLRTEILDPVAEKHIKKPTIESIKPRHYGPVAPAITPRKVGGLRKFIPRALKNRSWWI